MRGRCASLSEAYFLTRALIRSKRSSSKRCLNAFISSMERNLCTPLGKSIGGVIPRVSCQMANIRRPASSSVMFRHFASSNAFISSMERNLWTGISLLQLEALAQVVCIKLVLVADGVLLHLVECLGGDNADRHAIDFDDLRRKIRICESFPEARHHIDPKVRVRRVVLKAWIVTDHVVVLNLVDVRIVPDGAQGALDPDDVFRRRIDKEVGIFGIAIQAEEVHGHAAEHFVLDTLAIERFDDLEHLRRIDHYFNSTPSSSYGAFTPSVPNTVGYTSAMYGARVVA